MHCYALLQGFFPISTHSHWYISATLTQQELTQEPEGEWGSLPIHLLYPQENFKSCPRERRKVKYIHRIWEGCVYFLQYSMCSGWNIGAKYIPVERHLEEICLTLRYPIFEYLHSFIDDPQMLPLGILEDIKIQSRPWVLWALGPQHSCAI